MKQCISCKQIKREGDFHTRNGSPDGFRNDCKECVRRKMNERRSKYKEKNANRKNYPEVKYCKICNTTKSSEKFSFNAARMDGLHEYCKDCDKNRSKKWLMAHVHRRYKSYVNAAKNKDRQFSLSIEDFTILQSKECFYCGTISSEECVNGIDRINNKIGYTLENCVSCCSMCNYMKRGFDVELFLKQIKKICDKQMQSNIPAGDV